MIDTDKYEGHTPAPWKPHTVRWVKEDMVLFGFNEQDTRLIADAPLLLEEVKRLREAIKVATMDLEEPNMHDETRKDLLDMLKEMIE